MLKSTETRWILTSNEVAITEKWFEKYDEKFKSFDSFPRQDYYLKTNSDSLGIKIREPKKDSEGNILAKLELKSLTEDVGIQNFINQNVGVVNSWIKYSFELDKSKNPLDLIHFSNKNIKNEWLLIEKDRLLVKFDALTNKIVSSNEMISSGAGIELTKFKLNKIVYYTLGIEAFDENDNDKNVFFKTMESLFNDLELKHLAANNSKSYPQIISE
jgi:hypothetical protein